jgi:glycine cleavage system transcriptional repressor
MAHNLSLRFINQNINPVQLSNKSKGTTLMSKSVNNKLIISAITQDRPGIVKEISEVVNQSACNIEDSRMMVLGGSFAILMLVSGSDAAISALQKKEAQLSVALGAKSSGTIVQMQLTAERNLVEQGRPYIIEVISLDHPGIVKELSEFVAARQINIEALNTETYAAPHTGSTMFRLEMTVNIPASVKASTFKNDLIDFCDQKNLDVVVEPYTP